jgi:dGTPase
LWASLGRLVEKNHRKYPHLKDAHGYHMNDFGAIVAAASLAHDINPPFGHSEKKESIFDRKRTKIQRPTYRKEWQDLIDFEGNANGFSVPTSRPGLKEDFVFRMLPWCFYEISKESLPKTNQKYR